MVGDFLHCGGLKLSARVCGGVIGIAALFIAMTGKSFLRETARDVYREESAYHSVVQSGKLDNKNALYGAQQRTSTKPTATRQFRWDLKKPVDPSKVIDARAKAPKLPPDVTITCDVDDDGKACVFTLTGPADTITSLDLPIPATAIFDVVN